MLKSTLKNKDKGLVFICQVGDKELRVMKCLIGRNLKREILGLEIENITPDIDEKKLSESFGRALKKLGFNQHAVIISLPRSKATCRYIKVPTQSPKEIEEISSLQASRYLPYPAEELITGYQILSTDNQGYSEINLIIMHKDMADRLLKIFYELKASNLTIALSSYGLVNFLKVARPEERGIVMTIDIDYPQAELVVSLDNKMLFSRYFNIDINQAAWQDTLINEINKSRDTYMREVGKSAPEKIFFTGSPKYSSKIVKALSDASSLSAEVLPYEKLNLSGELLNLINSSESSFADLAGFGLKEIDDSLNLLPKNIKAQVRGSAKQKAQLRIALSVTAIIVILGLAVNKAMDNKALYLQKLRLELKKITKDAVALENIEKRFKFMENSLRNKPSALDVLYEAHQLIPPGVTLASLGFEEDKQVVFRGQAQELNSVFSFVSALQKSPTFKKFEVKVRYATKKSGSGGQALNFEIACTKGK